MTIDAHVHVWDLNRAEYRWLTPGIGDLYRSIDFGEIEPQLVARSGYPLVIVPSLFAASVDARANLTAYAESGGDLVVTYQTGVTDERGHITAGVI